MSSDELKVIKTETPDEVMFTLDDEPEVEKIPDATEGDVLNLQRDYWIMKNRVVEAWAKKHMGEDWNDREE